MLAILVVFFVHVSMPYQTVPGVWLIQDRQTHLAFTIFPAFAYQWVMPLFFFLSGASARLALVVRSRPRFLAERARRLLPPLFLGVIGITVFQEYLALSSKHPVEGGFFWFYPVYLSGCILRPGLGILRIGCLTSHLWFLAYLFIYSVIGLLWVGWLGSPRGRSWASQLAGWSQKPLGLWAFCLPAVFIHGLLRARFHAHQDWSDLLLWLTFFSLGCLFMQDERFLEVVEKRLWNALWTGLLSFSAMMVLLGLDRHVQDWELRPTFSSGYVLYQALRSLNTWAWVVFFLGMGIRYLNSRNGWLSYAHEAVLPFYILHHMVVVSLAFALLGWHPPLLIKFLALTMGTILISLGVYELLVRRVNGLRFLFGMRPRTQRPSTVK